MYKEKIQKHIDDISDALLSIEALLHKTLSDPAKNFTISYRGKTIEFCYPTTKKEEKLMAKNRKWLVSNLMYDSVNVKGWDTILGVANGVDPKDHQIEKYEQSFDAPLDLNGKPIKAVSLDFENYQVKQELFITCKNCTHSRIIGKDIKPGEVLTTWCFNPEKEFCEWDK